MGPVYARMHSISVMTMQMHVDSMPGLHNNYTTFKTSTPFFPIDLIPNYNNWVNFPMYEPIFS